MKRPACAILFVLALAACGDRGAKEPAQPSVENHTTVVFPEGSSQLASIIVVPIEPRREFSLRLNGRLIWDEDRTVRVFSPLAGRVITIRARVGDRVKAGQTLAVIGAPELGVAQSEARKAEQDHALAQKNLARVEELHAGGVAPLKDLQSAQADFARTAAERARTQQRLKLYGTEEAVDQQYALRSPIAGVVVERNLNPGQEARPDAPPDKPYFVVSDPARLWFLLDVAENDIGSVKSRMDVQIGSTSLGEDHVKGRITHVADVVDPQTRTVKVRGVVNNTDKRLKAEMFVVAELNVPTQGGLLAPSRAIYLRGEQYFAFAEAGNGKFTRKAVRIGPSYDGHQVVLQGLAANDKVVVEGNLLLERILAAKD